MTDIKITYKLRGTDGHAIHEIELQAEDKVAEIMKNGRFIYHMPAMWPDKCTEGNVRREPGYDIDCKLVSIEKVTVIRTTTSEMIYSDQDA